LDGPVTSRPGIAHRACPAEIERARSIRPRAERLPDGNYHWTTGRFGINEISPPRLLETGPSLQRALFALADASALATPINPDAAPLWSGIRQIFLGGTIKAALAC